MAAKEEKKEKAEQVITAIYKVNLHCRTCACAIKKPLLRTQGVQSVHVDLEKSEIKVKGVIDVVKIHKQIEKWSKKKVELISPKVEAKKATPATEKKTTETKKEVIHTTVLKVHLHCAKCEKDLQKKLLKHKGIHSVKIETKAQTLTVQGTIESTKLLTYIRKKVHKHAEIVSTKADSKDEKKKDDSKDEKKKDDSKDEKKKDDSKDEKKKDDSKDEKKKDEEKKKDGKGEGTKTTAVVEFTEKVKVEVKDKDGTTPYFIHYVYAPQLFSDENPNACFII